MSPITQPVSVRPSSASTQPRCVSLGTGNSNARIGMSTAAPIMAAAADVFRTSFPLRLRRFRPHRPLRVPVPFIVPCTPTRWPVGALLRRGDPATSLSPVMFSVNGSPLFSPEADDDDDGNTLKLAKAAHELSPIQSLSVLSGCGIGMESPGSPFRKCVMQGR
jgi:hypothetical protein